jgi:eukaryotic-like serine/threonine-protein kinase
MQRPRAPAPHPAILPIGTVVGHWRVVGWVGRGVYGAVYLAVRVGQEHAGPVALKVALFPRDPRFKLEATLLSRSDHPCIPRFIDAGEWKHPAGTIHPYVVMQWVDGVPLYDWAREHTPDSPQVLRLLAQLASALQSLHAQGALHRDLKGDNVLVRRDDGRAVLMDFGSCTYAGAPPLTPEPLPPGTPAYRSPEALLLDIRSVREPTVRYRASPADDLFALGVTACRLVTGEYPGFSEPFQDEAGTWKVESVIPPAALLDARVDERLRALILRMLSVHPEQRGTAAELAEALEQAAKQTAPKPAQAPVNAAAVPLSTPTPPTHAREGASWFVMAAVLVLAIAMWCSAPGHTWEKLAHTSAAASGPGKPDAGPVGLGDSAASVSTEDAAKTASLATVAEDTPPEPDPDQATPDAKGRCPHKRQVVLNGACWGPLQVEPEACEAAGDRCSRVSATCPSTHPSTSPLPSTLIRSEAHVRTFGHGRREKRCVLQPLCRSALRPPAGRSPIQPITVCWTLTTYQVQQIAKPSTRRIKRPTPHGGRHAGAGVLSTWRGSAQVRDRQEARGARPR